MFFTLLARNCSFSLPIVSFLQPKLQGQRETIFFGNAFQSKQTIPKGILVNDDRSYHEWKLYLVNATQKAYKSVMSIRLNLFFKIHKIHFLQIMKHSLFTVALQSGYTKQRRKDL